MSPNKGAMIANRALPPLLRRDGDMKKWLRIAAYVLGVLSVIGVAVVGCLAYVGYQVLFPQPKILECDRIPTRETDEFRYFAESAARWLELPEDARDVFICCARRAIRRTTAPLCSLLARFGALLS